ncbi:hypothetical protein MNBD_GAMMA03-505, partial [hydrothermal vent metagenome]
MKKLIFILSIFLLNSSAKAGGVLLLVGQGGGACTYDTIQDAINDATPNSEIRVSNEITYFENLQINKSLTIKGGYDDCEQAQLDNRLDDNRTIIDADLITNSVVLISVSPVEFNMSGFTLINGSSLYPDIPLGGAVSIMTEDSTINFEQMNITNNSGVVGGGIYLGGTGNDLVLSNTVINNNFANIGGGVYCINGTVSLNNNSGIYQNQAFDFKAPGNGGGIYGDNCAISLRSGEGGTADLYSVGISNNSAESLGGGIYVSDGYIVPSGYMGIINIDHNTAIDGGGVYMTNGARITLGRMFFANNTASGNGGALFMDNSQYNMNSTNLGFDICLINEQLIECNLFINNRATGGGFNLGGAIYMQNNSGGQGVNHSLRAKFINNRADGAAAIAVYSGSTLNLQNSYFIGNGNNGDDETDDFNVIRVNGAGSEIDVSFSTFANNLNSYVFALINNGQARLNKSIVYEDAVSNEVVSPTDSALFNFGCSLFHEGLTPGPFPGINNSLITTNPGFVNPALDNYHLRFDSPAIDRCNLSGLSADVEIRMDFDADERPIDIPDVSN